jgi:CBS domain containing-hemolysin-like protein
MTMTDHTTASNILPARADEGRYCRVSRYATVLALMFLLLPTDARASFLSPEAEDAMAKYLALFVIFVVPGVLITLFWMVHILPEKIAHKRHHPQIEAIRTLCLLSLVFGGLLWPLAWIWAYSKPVMHRLAYGPTAHDEDFVEPYPGETPTPAESLRERLARLEAKGLSEADLKTLTDDIDALEARVAGSSH